MEENIIQEEPIKIQEEPTPENQPKVEKKSIKISVKLIVIIAIIIVLGVLAYISKGLFVVATIDGNPISRLTLIQKLEKSFGKNLLDSMITEKLVENAAKDQNIVISSEDIDKEIKTIEDQISAQGGTMSEALAQQGMSLDDLRMQISLQKKLEKLLADKTNVTDEEVAQYVKDNVATIPEGQEAIINEQARAQLINQKFDTAAQALVDDLKTKAKIKYFVNY